MAVVRFIIFLVICVAASSAETCQPQIEACGTKAKVEKDNGLSNCTVIDDLIDCISLIPTSQCAPSDLSLLGMLLDQENKDREKYCNNPTTTTDSIPTTTDAIDCHTRAEMCATEADEDSKKGLDLCTLTTHFVNCLSSIPMTGCTNRVFILQLLQQLTENQNKYCHFSLPTTTEAIGCNTRAQVCATNASEDHKKGLNLCTLYTNFLNCLSKIQIQSCSDMEKAFVLQLFDNQKENKEKYCNPKSETSPLPTIKAQTTQFSSTRHLEDNGSRTNSVTLFGLVSVIVSMVIIV